MKKIRVNGLEVDRLFEASTLFAVDFCFFLFFSAEGSFGLNGALVIDKAIIIEHVQYSVCGIELIRLFCISQRMKLLPHSSSHLQTLHAIYANNIIIVKTCIRALSGAYI